MGSRAQRHRSKQAHEGQSPWPYLKLLNSRQPHRQRPERRVPQPWRINRILIAVQGDMAIKHIVNEQRDFPSALLAPARSDTKFVAGAFRVAGLYEYVSADPVR